MTTRGDEWLTIELPPFDPKDWKAWRMRVFESLQAEAIARQVSWRDEEPLELDVRIPVDGNVTFRDVDNLLKHVLDAMQGQLGQPKKERKRTGPVANDHQVYRLVAEKVDAARFPHGHLALRPYVADDREQRVDGPLTRTQRAAQSCGAVP